MSALPFPAAEPLDPAAWREGLELPRWELAVTTTLIVTGAVASRDFYAGHHDRDAARAAGSPDVFMNIMTTAGLVGRYLTDLTGPDGRLDDLDLRLGAPNRPGDVLELGGEVVGTADGPDGSLLIDIAYRGTNARGAHAHGTARIDLARAGRNAAAHAPVAGGGEQPLPRGPHGRGAPHDSHHEEGTGED